MITLSAPIIRRRSSRRERSPTPIKTRIQDDITLGKFWGMNLEIIGRRSRVARLWSNAELRRIAPHFEGAVVNVSGWKDEDKEGGHYAPYFVNASSYQVTNHAGERGLQDGVSEIGLNLEEPLDEKLAGKFDVVLNHTTLEHIFDVTLAMQNLCRMSRDVVIVVVPCLQHVHFKDDFKDFWRFTPFTLRRMFEANGFGVVYESASPEEENASVYLLAIASRKPELWKDLLPPGEIEDERIGIGTIRNDPFTLIATRIYKRLWRWRWYRKLTKKFIKQSIIGD